MARNELEGYQVAPGLEWRVDRLRSVLGKRGQGFLYLFGRGTNEMGAAPFGRWELEVRTRNRGRDGVSPTDNQRVVATQYLNPSPFWMPDALGITNEVTAEAQRWMREGCQAGGLEVMGANLQIVVNPVTEHSNIYGSFLVRSAGLVAS